MTADSETARIFRVGIPVDAQAIRSLLLQSNLSAPSVRDLEVARQSIIGEIQSFVCEQQGQIDGVLRWRNLGEEAEILDLAIAPRFRRQGHGSFLLENFIEQFRQSTVQRIFLEVRESNGAAIALYKKFGFQISGRRPNYYRNPEENALLMTLSLPA